MIYPLCQKKLKKLIFVKLTERRELKEEEKKNLQLAFSRKVNTLFKNKN